MNIKTLLFYFITLLFTTFLHVNFIPKVYALNCDNISLSCTAPPYINFGDDITIEIKATTIIDEPYFCHGGDSGKIQVKLNNSNMQEACCNKVSNQPYTEANVTYAGLAIDTYNYSVETIEGVDCEDECIGTFIVKDPNESEPDPVTQTADKPCDVVIGSINETDAGIQTELGCIPVVPNLFVMWLIKFLIPLSGGFGFIILIIGSIGLMTAAGNPEKIAKAQQLITSAIAGMLFVVFSLYLFYLIGVQIIRIPGLTAYG